MYCLCTNDGTQASSSANIFLDSKGVVLGGRLSYCGLLGFLGNVTDYYCLGSPLSCFYVLKNI